MAQAASSERRSDTDAPHRARNRALRILFQADLRSADATQLLDHLDTDASALALLDERDDLPEAPEVAAEPAARQGPATPLDGFTRSLVRGVVENRERIDALITRHARRWQISRMPVIDRTVLRLATYELLYESTPPAVAINEAVTLAKSLSTDDSGRYVNGVLEAVRRDLAAREDEAPEN